MFTETLKLGIRIATIAIITALIVAVLSWVTVPAISTNDFATAIGFGKAIFDYYLAGYQPWFGVGITLLTIKFIILPVLQLALIGPKITMRVNEG